MRVEDRIILAADGLTLDETVELTKKVGKLVYGIKIHSLFDAHGQSAVETIKGAGTDIVWVDEKLHDIPETVGARTKVIEQSGANIVTVHASGGIKMMMAARKGTDIEVFGVTLLTSLSVQDIDFLFGRPAEKVVLELARWAQLARMHGIVCSPQEVGLLSRQPELYGMKFIVPGIRSAGVDVHDQQRIGTPAEAIVNGATHLVIGRQITQATDPVAVIGQIFEEIKEGERMLREKGSKS